MSLITGARAEVVGGSAAAELVESHLEGENGMRQNHKLSGSTNTARIEEQGSNVVVHRITALAYVASQRCSGRCLSADIIRIMSRSTSHRLSGIVARSASSQSTRSMSVIS